MPAFLIAVRMSACASGALLCSSMSIFAAYAPFDVSITTFGALPMTICRSTMSPSIGVSLLGIQSA